MPISFLFRIDRLEPTFAFQAPLVNFYGWTPPLRGDQYNRWSGILYRWQDGVVTPVLQQEPISSSILNSSSPLHYSSASIFSQYPDGTQFFAVNFDVTQTTEFDHWFSPGFHHLSVRGQENLKYSYLDFVTENSCLAAPDWSPNNWMSNLFPDQFRYRSDNTEPVPNSAGVLGKLPLLLGFAAFSCREDHLDHVLRNSLQFKRWIPHRSVPSC